MELILVVVISAGMAENSHNGVSRSLRRLFRLPMRTHCTLLHHINYVVTYQLKGNCMPDFSNLLDHVC